jgi:hypothetical protein
MHIYTNRDGQPAGPVRIFDIEARTRYRIAAHSAHEALEALHDLDACTPHDLDGIDVNFIASCSVDESTISDVSNEYGVTSSFYEDHRERCAECRAVKAS